MRGDQLSRQWRVLRQIEASRYGLTATEIAELSGVSLRTAYRDLDDLQLAGFPLYAEKKEHGQCWRFTPSYRIKVPNPFTFTELMSLHLSRDLFQVFKGTAFFESIESLFEKVRASLPPQAMVYLQRVQSAFHMGIRPYRNYERFRGIISQVNRAVMAQRRIEMAYRSLGDKDETLRCVDPYRVWFFDGTIYMIAFCHLRGEMRTFVLDRIKVLRVTEERFEPSPDFDLEDYLRHSFRVMRDELYAVKIRISPAWARYVEERIWHESQRIRYLPDGALEIDFQVAGLEEIRQWVMAMGSDALVVSPTRLKTLVRQELRRALDQYQRKGPQLQAQIDSSAR